MHLFGLDSSNSAIEANDGVIIVEGQIDCIKCHANGFLNSVALTGSDLTMQQAFLLKRKTNNFFLLLDNDAAGEKAIKKILSNYSKFVNIHIVSLPAQYNDVDDYLTKSDNHSILSNLVSYR
jgi:DNA primase